MRTLLFTWIFGFIFAVAAIAVAANSWSTTPLSALDVSSVVEAVEGG